MTDRETTPAGPQPGETSGRCPICDSRVSPADTHCLMCGALLPPPPPALPESPTANRQSLTPAPSPQPPVPSPQEMPIFEAVVRERQSPVTVWLTAFFAAITAVLGFLVLQDPQPLAVALFPTLTAFPPTATFTPTWTPIPTETGPPTATPTITPTPLPTDTPPPPRFHRVISGETLFALGLRYDVSAASIAAANAVPADAALQIGQNLLIPHPTATPPLVPVAIEVGSEMCIADPAGCQLYQIQSGDSLFSIANRLSINLEALIGVNRLTDQVLLQPGDTLCIPQFTCGGVLPPTPGPSPTPTATRPPAGPQLLYPAHNTVVEPPDQTIVLQWAAVKTLQETEWYMIELRDLSVVDSHANRGFTRHTSFQVPSSWRPDEPESHLFHWRVAIVQVTGRRADGGFIFTFGGSASEDAYFTWLGAVPTPTPTPTPEPTATP